MLSANQKKSPGLTLQMGHLELTSIARISGIFNVCSHIVISKKR